MVTHVATTGFRSHFSKDLCQHTYLVQALAPAPTLAMRELNTRDEQCANE